MSFSALIIVLGCGGLFCNAAQPVNQAAERILFAVDGGKIHMHVRISYQGPSTEFGWLLPAPGVPEVALSSEQLFTALDASYGPIFTLNNEFDGGCDIAFGSSVDVPRAEDEGGVTVLSREQVGPYDQVVLEAESVEVLREWLDTNEFAIPAEVDGKLGPYIESGYVFVAVKLLPGQDSGDIVPLRISFDGDRPQIPIIPTSVAAEKDMGVIVHVLGSSRAIPLNYRHVQINEAAIDWRNGGQNYADVVSQAADEAEGHAFATDYAGELNQQLVTRIADDLIETIAAATKVSDLPQGVDFGAFADSDLQRVIGAGLPESIAPADFFGCPSCYFDSEDAIDGAAIADEIRTNVQPARENLEALFLKFTYLSRLYSTLSPTEMTVDPMFGFNEGLDDVSRTRTATLRIPCQSEEPSFDDAVVVLADGRELQDDPDGAALIRREDGETVGGIGVAGAALIEQHSESGEPQILSQIDGGVGASGSGSVDDDGCGCKATGHSPVAIASIALLGLAGVRRRRR